MRQTLSYCIIHNMILCEMTSNYIIHCRPSATRTMSQRGRRIWLYHIICVRCDGECVGPYLLVFDTLWYNIILYHNIYISYIASMGSIYCDGIQVSHQYTISHNVHACMHACMRATRVGGGDITQARYRILHKYRLIK